MPVLSNTTVSICAKRSSASAALSNTPPRNKAPLATTCTAGTASASAQGQVTISTEMAVTSASWIDAPRHSQNSAVASAARCTTGA